MMQAVGLDIGGTKTLAVRLDADGNILDREVVSTPADDVDGMLVSAAAAVAAVTSDDVSAVGAGVAGMVGDGVVVFAPNLAWRNLQVAARISAATGLPCVADNDANVATWGEFRLGAGRGRDHVLMLTVGTGIGAGIVSGGRLLHGSHGFAGEVGHIIVEPDGPLCGCGNRGCWETVASGRAIDRLSREAFGEGAPSGTGITELAGGGDPTALEVLGEVGRRLGEGIAGLVNVLDPEIVVIGGGVVEAGDLLLEPTRRHFLASIEAPEFRPEVPIVPAALGPDAGAIGAALLALAEAQS